VIAESTEEFEERPSSTGMVERRVANRRFHPRFAVDCAAAVFPVNGGVPILGRLSDISLSGCRVATDHRYPPTMLTRVEVEMELRGIPLRIAGVSLGSRGAKRFAVRFLDLSERRQSQLAELLGELQDDSERREEAEEPATEGAFASSTRASDFPQ
jgi:PilZ domain